MKVIQWEDGIVDQMLSSLEQHGYFEYPGFLSKKRSSDIRMLMDEHYSREAFRKAGVGKGAQFSIDEDIRSDSILWIHQHQAHPLVQAYCNQIDQLIPILNRAFFLNLKDKEMMYAIYEPGSHYSRHKDRFESISHRLITVVLYLTEWAPGNGGELVLFANQTQRISPREGTLILFRSELEHEVLKTNIYRYSITGWLTDVPIGLTFLK